MERRTIGELEVSVLGLGANSFGTDFFGARCDQDQVTRIVNTALDAGVNLIDTAEEYSITSFLGVGRSEECIGVALGSRRDEAVIATKFLPVLRDRPEERGADRIVAAVEASLRRLGTDRIDLYQQHQPDPDTPLEEILTALDRLVRDGKVREIGCCNFGPEMIAEAHGVSDASGLARFVSNQTHHNLLRGPTPEGITEACRRHDVALLPYFPLASGLLTGKYRPGEEPPPGSRFAADTFVSNLLAEGAFTEESLARLARFEDFAEERGRSLLELALPWLAAQPEVASVVAGATRPEHVTANAAALDRVLTSEELAAVDRLRAGDPA